MTVMHGFPKVIFDHRAIRSLGEALAERGISRPLIITDRGLVEHGIAARLVAALPAGMGHALCDAIPPNPTIAGVEAALAAYRAGDCDGIVGLGGGSVLDSGKALRVVATHEAPLMSYLREPARITADVAPYITVPTTAGTGAEITFGGGIHPVANAHALGIRSPHVKPDIAICDPDLTVTLPPGLTAATGMDAMGHCIEGFLATTIDPPGKAIALDGIGRVARHIEAACADGSDREARWHMLMAALQGGMSIYMGLGPIHALAHAFGNSPLHHGALVTIATPAVLCFYKGHVDDKLAAIAGAMGLAPGTDVAAGVAALNARLGLPAGIAALGYHGDDIDTLAATAHASYFNNPAPRRPTIGQYREIVAEALG